MARRDSMTAFGQLAEAIGNLRRVVFDALGRVVESIAAVDIQLGELTQAQRRAPIEAGSRMAGHRFLSWFVGGALR